MHSSIASLSGREVEQAATREWSPRKEVNGAVIRMVRRQGQGVGFAEHRSKVMVLLWNGGQARRCGHGLELRRPRRLSGPQTLGQTVCTPRHDSSRSPINLGVVGFEPGVTQNHRGEWAGNHQKRDGHVVIPQNEQVDRNCMVLDSRECSV